MPCVAIMTGENRRSGRLQFNGRCHCQEVLWFVLTLPVVQSFVSQAEKAEGYIDLTNFVIDRAIECKKKQ